MSNTRYAQIKLPTVNDLDPHPRLFVEGEGIHAGDCFKALFPDGWYDISIEFDDSREGVACWYIATPGFGDISPIGLFVQV